MTTTVTIDPNIRVRDNLTYAGFEDITGPFFEGALVTVLEVESGLVGKGRITSTDPEKRLVYLRVDWSTLAIPQTLPVFHWTAASLSHSTSGPHAT